MDGFNCLACGTTACYQPPDRRMLPDNCPMRCAGDVLAAARQQLGETQSMQLAQAAARTEAAGYCRWTRIEETMDFARRIGAMHLGIACCIGLRREAEIAQRIFQANGFGVTGVICKAGGIDKAELGLDRSEQVRLSEYEAACNPIGQARLLDAAGCGLNVLIGLCVGHDSLFFRHSQAPCTVLVAKDRVLGHNPCAALYTAHSYYKRLAETS